MSAKDSLPNLTSGPDGELRRLHSLVADLDAVVWEADAASRRFTYVSEGAGDILGYTPRQWLAEPSFWEEHIHPEDREMVVEEFLRAATLGTPRDTEYRFIAGDGETRWVRDIGHVVNDAEGAPLLVRGLMVDVTSRKAIEEQHRDAESRYRALVEHLPAIVYIEAVHGGEDDPGRLLYVSPQVEEILGFAPAEWLDDPTAWVRQFHEDDRSRVRSEFERVSESGEPFTAEYRMMAKDGRTVWLRDDAVLLRNQDGSPLFWQGVMHDITRQRESEERAHGTEARFRALVESLPAIVYSEPLGDETLAVEYVSPHAFDLLGISPQEWMADPMTWLNAIHPDDRRGVEELNERSDRSGIPFVAEYRMLTRDGRIRWFHDEAALVRDEDGQPMLWQGVMVDVTERRRAEELERDLVIERETAERLREVDEIKNTFLQAVSHDLRTPLAAILGLAVTLGRTDINIDPAETREMAQRIATNARKLDRLVNDLLDLDRLSRGIVEPVLKPVGVDELVRRLVEESDLLGERRIDVRTRPVVIPIDAAKVERIVENLLANAAKHTPPGARVWIGARPLDGGALIVVEDDGPGVPEEFRETVFEPFRRGPASPAGAPGVGVGLSLVARFAGLHGGRAWVEEREGGGASFRVFLPGGSSSREPR